MEYRSLGNTGLTLSVFSLGTMRALGSEAVFQDTVKAAIAQGINHLETAQGYGTSEGWLGRVLKTLEPETRSRLVVTTKLPPTPDAESMAQALAKSLGNLQLDTIDCLAIHGLNTPEHLAWVTDPQGCMAALWAAQAAGQVKHIGFSSHGTRELIEAAILTGYFAFVNLHYYYFFQRHGAIVDLATERGMGVFIISPADKGGQLYTPPETLRSLCQPFDPLHLTYRWLLSDPRITTLSVGPAQPKELPHPLAVAEATHPLTAAEREAIARLEHHAEQALGTTQCHQCYACLPCPEAINIPEVLRLRNLAVAYDMTTFGQYRYGMFENAGHWFPGRRGDRCTECGDCLPRCPTGLDIPTLLRDTHERLKGNPRRRLWG